MTPDQMNPAICSSALDDNGNNAHADDSTCGRHIWDGTTCAECGTTRDEYTDPPKMTRERAIMLADLVLTDFLETHRDTAEVEPTNDDIIDAFIVLGVINPTK